jgi:hypothetical protein
METNYFRLFEEHANFQYNIEYSHDQEIQPLSEEKKIIQDWSLDGIKVVSVKGEISFADYLLTLLLSNETVLEFTYHYSQGPGASGDDSFASFQIIEKGKDKEYFDDVYDEYMDSEGWQSGMLVLGVLNLYEDIKGKKHGHYTGKNYGI